MRYLLTAASVALLATAAAAQGAPAPLPPNYIQVTAPTAQRLVQQALRANPGLRKLGLHATPAGAADNAIIASDAPAKIGKKSSPADLEHLASGRPFVARIDEGGIYDLLLPITDRAGRDIGQGFVVMEVPIGTVADEAAALAVGRRVRDALQRTIPSKAALYRP